MQQTRALTLKRRRPYLYRQQAPKRRRIAQARLARKRLNLAMRPEKKYYDTALFGGAIVNASTGAEQDPNATSMISTPVQGDGDQDRDGKKIVIHSVVLRGAVTTAEIEAATSPAVATTVMVALVLDTQTNGAQLNSEDVFTNPTSQASIVTESLNDMVFQPRFKILRRMTITIQPPVMNEGAVNSFATGTTRTPFSVYHKFPAGLPINFNAGTTASVANVIDNSLHVIAFCSSTVLTPLLSYNARIRFTG